MNDKTREIFDRINALSKDELMQYASGGDFWFSGKEDGLTNEIGKLELNEAVKLLKALCEAKGIDMSALAGGGAAAEVEEVDPNQLFEIIVKSLKDVTAKTSAILYVKGAAAAVDPTWTLASAKDRIDALITKSEPFVFPGSYQKGDALDAIIKGLNDKHLVTEIKAKPAAAKK